MPGTLQEKLPPAKIINAEKVIYDEVCSINNISSGFIFTKPLIYRNMHDQFNPSRRMKWHI